MFPVFYLKNRKGDDLDLRGQATFVNKGNPIVAAAWECFQTMSDKEGVVVWYGGEGWTTPMKWVQVIQTPDGYDYELKK